jgi:hypothetical protein
MYPIKNWFLNYVRESSKAIAKNNLIKNGQRFWTDIFQSIYTNNSQIYENMVNVSSYLILDSTSYLLHSYYQKVKIDPVSGLVPEGRGDIQGKGGGGWM